MKNEKLKIKNERLKNASRISMWLLLVCVGLTVVGWGQTGAGEAARVWKNPPERIAVNEQFSYIYQKDTSSEITVVHILFRGGMRAVPVVRRGLAFITSRLTVEVSSNDDLRELMHLGSTIQSNIEGDFTTTTIRTLSENLEPTLKLLSKSIRKPLISGLRVDNLKRFMAHNEKSEKDIPERLMEQAFLSAFSGDNAHGYGGSIFGDKASRKGIRRKMAAAFHKQYFTSANMVMVVTTDLDKDKITGLLRGNFASLPAGKKAPLPPVSPAVPKQKKITIDKDNQQVLIAFGALLPGIDAASPANYVRIFMLENLLGRGIGSKLWPLRSRKDLAYSLNSRFLQMKEGGLLMIYMKSEKAKKEAAYNALKSLLVNFHNSGVSEDELAVTKVLSRAEFLRNSETKDQRAAKLAYFQALGPGFDFIERLIGEIDNTSLDQLNGYLKKILEPSRLVEVLIGPGS